MLEKVHSGSVGVLWNITIPMIQEINSSTLRPENSATRRFFRWLINERIADGAFLDFFLIGKEAEAVHIVNMIQGITRKKVGLKPSSEQLTYGDEIYEKD